MHAFWKKKRKKRTRSAASLPPYKTNSWKEKKKKNQPIFFLHEKSDKANSVKKEKSLAASFRGRSVTPNCGEKKE